MATVTGFTAERMLEMENATIIDGHISGSDLILVTKEGTFINAGNVRGPQGIQGPVGPLTQADADTRYVNIGGDTMSGLLIIDRGAAECLRLRSVDVPYMSFYKGATRLGFIQAQSDEFKIYTDTDNPMTFFTGGAENMRLRTTSSAETLTLAGKTPDCLIYFRNTSPSGTAFGYVGKHSTWGIRATALTGDALLQGANGDARVQAKYSVDIYPGDAHCASFLPQGHVMFAKDETEDDVPGFWWRDDWKSIRSTCNVDGASSIYLNRQGGATGMTEPFMTFDVNKTKVGSITRSSTGIAYNNTSDYRIKDVKGPIKDALQRLGLLKPIRAVYKEDTSKAEVDTFVAHEVSPAVPEAVMGAKDAVDEFGHPSLQQLDMKQLIPLLVASVQELSAKVTDLEARLAAT
jgi:hypothetical protein